MGDLVLDQLRAQLMAATDNLVAIEAERFVPPKPGQPLDRYSLQLEHTSQQIMWEARIGVAVVIADLRSLHGEAYAAARARAVAACLHLLQLLDTVDVSEVNERTYVEEMRRILDDIISRLTGRVAVPAVPALPAAR